MFPSHWYSKLHFFPNLRCRSKHSPVFSGKIIHFYLFQGLSNTPAIAEYFENDNYEEDINEENPLGMKGEIARAFGQLIKDIWSGR